MAQGNTNPDLGCKGPERAESNRAGGTRELLSRGAHPSQPREFQLTARAGLGRSAQDDTGELKGQHSKGERQQRCSAAHRGH